RHADAHFGGHYGNIDSHASGGDRDIHLHADGANGHARAWLDAEPAAGPSGNLSHSTLPEASFAATCRGERSKGAARPAPDSRVTSTSDHQPSMWLVLVAWLSPHEPLPWRSAP